MNASISLDLDNQWAYMKVHGDEGWDNYPSYFDKFLPHGLKMLEKYNLKITFFIVGRDADDIKNREVLKEIPKFGHEVGNHSYNHEAWFHLYSNDEIYKELNDTEAAIEKSTGLLPNGFRGPGFSRSKSLFKILLEKKYIYDASTLPTWIGPLARAYYFRQSDLTKEERETRKGLFGSFSDGLNRIKPFYWNLENEQKLLEIPVSTIPILRVPFHFSYLHYLANVSVAAMKTYLQTAITFCKITNTEPSFLLHPLDLIGGDLIPELKFFPGMELSSSYKTELFDIVMEKMTSNFNLVNMSEHAEIILKRNNLPHKTAA
ncbi:MAG: polysaccharide deacetylase family protein [Ignavibacteriae bacterium]|nr:polysaccharide deacetylase family protein [Ignavibacteriota bacterium]MCB9207126.1 polysaccharide deacetylase family protein [Ignavibacteriales bacterium]MCB9218664.1 polysaccharide deacetylase family protein [Ignavibacteriales bacterium]MCB9259330.1 polysaccharide deacetylase family protein [Ignavibacteriales bacterium]